MLTPDLTDPAAPGLDRPPPPGRTPWRMTLRAWAPAARGMPLPTLAAVGSLALTPMLVVVLNRGRDATGALLAATIVTGAAAAFAVDDPAEETLSASPTSLARRRLLRLSVIVLGVAALALVLISAADAVGPVRGADLARRAAELLATAGLATAIGGLARRQAMVGAAPGAALAAALVVLMVSALSQRFDVLPGLVDSPQHDRWWLVALGAWGVTAWTWRDPAR